MSALTNEEYAARVLEIATPDEGFVPTAYYDPDGDCIEFLARPDNFYAERVDDLVTVYRSEENDEIIGSLLKGVTPLCQKLLNRFPAFRIVVEDGKAKLGHIFLANLLAAANPDDVVTLTYRKLIVVAGEIEVALKKAA